MASLTALIIEDDINSARVLEHLLTKEDIESIILTDLNQLDNHLNDSHDIVFIDLEMPNMTGYDVLSVLLNEAHFNTIPIIATSVHSGEINNVRDAGFHSFIGKPLAKDVFPNQLQRILSGENVWEV